MLERKEPELTIKVAEIYRELGLDPRSREIAEGLYSSSSDLQWRQNAALQRAMVARDLDDLVTWLQRSDQNSFHVKTRLLDTTGDRHLRDGRLAEADRAYEKWRGSTTTSRPPRQRGQQRRDRIQQPLWSHRRRRSPARGRQTAGGRGAHGAPERHRGRQPRGHPEPSGLRDRPGEMGTDRVLFLDQSEAAALLSRLQAGPLRPQVLSALHDEPAVRRFLDATRQEQVLAPQKIDPYYRQLGLLRWSRDLAGLRALAATVNAVQGMAGADVGDRQAWRSGERDVQARGDADRSVRSRRRGWSARTRPDTLPPSPRPTCSTRTTWIRARSSIPRRSRTPPAPRPGGARRRPGPRPPPRGTCPGPAQRRRLASGPELPAAEGRPRQGAPRLRAGQPALPRGVGRLGPAGADGAARAARAVQACRLRASAAAQDPATMDWVTARLAGDAGLERQARRVFEREDWRCRRDPGAAAARRRGRPGRPGPVRGQPPHADGRPGSLTGARPGLSRRAPERH